MDYLHNNLDMLPVESIHIHITKFIIQSLIDKEIDISLNIHIFLSKIISNSPRIATI